MSQSTCQVLKQCVIDTNMNYSSSYLRYRSISFSISTPHFFPRQLQPKDAFTFCEEKATAALQCSRREVSLCRTHDQRHHHSTNIQGKTILSKAHRNGYLSYARTIITSQLSYQSSPYAILHQIRNRGSTCRSSRIKARCREDVSPST
jgi:hypothetical protein